MKLANISAWASIIGCAISMYLFYFSFRLPTILRDYSITVEYNKKRQELINEFQANINLLTDETETIDNRLKAKLYDDVYNLNTYRPILEKGIRDTIDKTIDLLRLNNEQIDEGELIHHLTKLKTSCNSSISKGVLMYE